MTLKVLCSIYHRSDLILRPSLFYAGSYKQPRVVGTHRGGKIIHSSWLIRDWLEKTCTLSSWLNSSLTSSSLTELDSFTFSLSIIKG